MTGAFHDQELRVAGDHFDGLLQFFNRSERIARAVDEQRRRVQTWQMLRALLLGFARRVQGIGEQQQSRGNFRIFGAQHARLAAAIRVAAEKNMAWNFLPERGDRILQSFAVVRGIARPGGSPGSRLPKGQIAAQHGESRGAKRFSHGDQQWSLRIPAGAVSQNQAVAVAVGRLGNVEESANVGFEGVIDERVCG